MNQKLRGLGDEWVIRLFFFLLVLCGASPGSLWLQAVSKMWLAVQSVPRPAFCISSANTRVGFSGICFELFASADVLKTCRNKTMLIFVSLWMSGRCLKRRPAQRGQWCFPGLTRPTRCRCNAVMPGASEETQRYTVPKLLINSPNKKAKEIAACTLWPDQAVVRHQGSLDHHRAAS